METKPLTVGIANYEAPVNVYFFERPDGTQIHVDEKTAWSMYSRPQQTFWGKVRFKYLGTTNGRQYAQAVAESQVLFREKGLEAAQERMRRAWSEELELALKNQTPPRNFDKVDKNGQPVDMSRL